jgi:Flp pilus assembly protein TadD
MDEVMAQARAKAAEEDALPSEEKLALQKKKDAVAKKDEGNIAYKAKKFDEAKALYQEAIDMDPQELLFYTNMAAVYMAEKNYDAAIAECDKAIELTKGCQYDFVKLGKALARKAKALGMACRFEESI